MYSFRDIDSFTPLYYEKQGMLKFKLWMENKHNFIKSLSRYERGLFKPRRKEYGRSLDLFCGNHYGETVGSILADKIKMPACKSELVKVHTEKNKYTNGVIKLKEGCISYSELHRNETLIPGNILIERFKSIDPRRYYSLSDIPISSDRSNNNIEVILAAIETTLRNEHIPEEKIKDTKRKMIQMVIYDCAFGNNDRHDENWSFARNFTTNEIRLYPAYDNERVLGLYENHQFVSAATEKNIVKETSDTFLRSRMGYPGRDENVPYEDMLRYLSERYPEESLEFMRTIVDNVKEDDIRSILSDLEGLLPEYIEFGVQAYSYRRETMQQLINKIIDKQNESGISK